MGTSAASSNATYEYIDLWSRSTTWGGGPPPVEGDSVWIRPGQRILYDVSSPRLYMLIIQGEFIFDRTDLTLDANYIFVMGKGSAFVVGTEDEPFLHQALITLHGSPVSKELPLYGAKVLAYISHTSYLYFHYISPLYLPYISLNLPYISSSTAPRCSPAASAPSICTAGPSLTAACTPSSLPRRRRATPPSC